MASARSGRMIRDPKRVKGLNVSEKDRRKLYKKRVLGMS
jgi:hypothetical protein